MQRRALVLSFTIKMGKCGVLTTEPHDNKKYEIESLMINNGREIKCDTIKIKAKYQYLLEKFISFNTEYSRDGICTGEYYSSKNDGKLPFNVFIAISYVKQTLTLEFSSKILFDDYPKLINRGTIRKCLINLNSLGICRIDIDGVLQTGCITKADITKDIKMHLTDDILSALNENVGMYRRYKWKHYRKTGIEFSRDVKDGRSKESLKLYDKGAELKANAESRKFLSMLTNYEDIENYFDGMVRFEISLQSTAKIREFLNIQDTYINEFFNADANPILKMFDKIFIVKSNSIDFRCSTYNEWSMLIILDYFHGDLQQIEQNIRNVYADRKGAYSRMKQFEQVKTKNNNCQQDIISEIRRQLI